MNKRIQKKKRVLKRLNELENSNGQFILILEKYAVTLNGLINSNDRLLTVTEKAIDNIDKICEILRNNNKDNQ